MVTSLHDSDKEENMRLSDDGHTTANTCHEKIRSFGLQTFVKSVLLEIKLEILYQNNQKFGSHSETNNIPD